MRPQGISNQPMSRVEVETVVTNVVHLTLSQEDADELTAVLGCMVGGRLQHLYNALVGNGLRHRGHRYNSVMLIPTGLPEDEED